MFRQSRLLSHPPFLQKNRRDRAVGLDRVRDCERRSRISFGSSTRENSRPITLGVVFGTVLSCPAHRNTLQASRCLVSQQGPRMTEGTTTTTLKHNYTLCECE